VTLQELRKLETYERFGARYPWAVRPDFGGPFVTTEDDWHEGVRRLERYHAALEEIRRARVLRPGANPYLELVRILATPDGGGWEWDLPRGLYQMLNPSQRRRELAALFAWAIPGDDVLEVLGRHGPLVECGAGNGYWTALMQQRGVDVVAYDIRRSRSWARVHRSSSVAAVRRHRDRVLFLCWPSLDDDAASYAPLRAYAGDVFAYVGEARAGVTGSVRFHRELDLNWTLVEEVELPHWPWLRDCLRVYRRNPVRRPLQERDRCPECRRFVPTGSIGRCDWCFERRPPAIALRVGRHRVEYPARYLESIPDALRTSLEESPNRIL
jgi:hypothetical protein